MAHRKGVASIAIVVLVSVMILDTFVLLSVPPNPSDSVLRAKFLEMAKKYNIPSVILMGISYTESGWKQFDSAGNPIIHTNTDGSIDIGIMQINSNGRSDLDKLKQDVFYNIEIGAKILDGKWKITPAIGDSDRNILENWYYAIWAYNGFSYTNHPLNPTGRHYQDKVIDNIAKLIIGDDGQPLWTPIKITKPDPNIITNPPTYIDTPTPYHFGDLYMNPEDNVRIVQANTDLIMPVGSDVHLQFLVQNVGTSTWAASIFNAPYSVKLTLAGAGVKIEKTLSIIKKVQPGETYLLDFVVNTSSVGTYDCTLEFFDNGESFGEKVLTSVEFDSFTFSDLNPPQVSINNYTVNLNFNTNIPIGVMPYLFVNYKTGNGVKNDIVKGSISNGQILFSFLPKFKVAGSIDIDTYVAFSKADFLTPTFSYFYKGSYTLNFNTQDGIILDSYPSASISVDGTQTNLTTPAFVNLTSGAHTITLALQNYNTQTINLNYNSFDYVFVAMSQAVKQAPQVSVSSFDYGSLKENEAKFANVLIQAPEANSAMFLTSSSKMFSFYPSSVSGMQVVTVVADARWGNLGQNSSTISFSYSGVKATFSVSANVEMVGAALKANPTNITVRVPEILNFDVVLSTNVNINKLSFTLTYPMENLEFLSYTSNYMTEQMGVFYLMDGVTLETGNEITILSLSFKALKENSAKVLVSFDNISASNGSQVKAVSTPLEVTVLEQLVLPSKVENINITNNISEIDLSFSASREGTYKIAYYEIYRNTSPDLPSAIFVGTTTKTKFTDRGPFKKGTTYYYWVIAVDEKGNSSPPSQTFSILPIIFSGTKVSSVKLEFYIGQPYYYINGIRMNMDVVPIIIEGRTFVPVRYIAEPLGAQVIWKADTREVIIAFESNIIQLYIGNPVAVVNDVNTPIDKDNLKVAPFIVDGRTMLPLRFISETFGAEVQWENATKKITINYKSKE